MVEVSMSMEEYLALINAMPLPERSLEMTMDEVVRKPIKTASRTKTKYQKRYKREFNRIAPSYKTKNGKWKKGGFKAAVKAAHRATRRSLS
jgi:hypothetical protein